MIGRYVFIALTGLAVMRAATITVPAVAGGSGLMCYNSIPNGPCVADRPTPAVDGTITDNTFQAGAADSTEFLQTPPSNPDVSTPAPAGLSLDETWLWNLTTAGSPRQGVIVYSLFGSGYGGGNQVEAGDINISGVNTNNTNFPGWYGNNILSKQGKTTFELGIPFTVSIDSGAYDRTGEGEDYLDVSSTLVLNFPFSNLTA